MPFEKITLLCFGASYAVALGLELWHLLRPRRVFHLLGLGFGAAGLFAHTVYLLVQNLPLSSQYGSVLFLAWVMAVFYLYGSIHHRNRSWAVFVLPLVCLLVVVAWLAAQPWPGFEPEEHFWRVAHVVLLVLAGVGVSVAFLASIMYLVQARRLKARLLPRKGMSLLSLERLEAMNRRAITLAFPLLTAGLLVGLGLLRGPGKELAWSDPKVVASVVLWLVFLLLFYQRHGRQRGGRHAAWLTILAFSLLLFTLVWPHVGTGGVP
jgi:ABC-type transport system involved in cytochrome c biogenesis permease subunit